MRSVKRKISQVIYGKGRGWAFSRTDFSTIGTRASIDVALHTLCEKGEIRRVIRGIYDYPGFSKSLNQQLGPDVDQVAQALARKFKWEIEPSGPAALNTIGLSTQVVGKYLYRSSGPDRTYEIGKVSLVFRNSTTKEIGFKHHESAIIVQALKSLGKERISQEKLNKIRRWLDPSLKLLILKDTNTVSGWIYDSIREICRED